MYNIYSNFYGQSYQVLCTIESNFKKEIITRAKKLKKTYHKTLLESVRSRIKSPESMREKLIRKGYNITTNNALTKVYDALGIRLICGLINDVYVLAKEIKKMDNYEVLCEKDYIKNPKINGYRGYHLILKVKSGSAEGYNFEVQIRTLAIDCWASLEHQIKYKKNISNEKLFTNELKRCADELASIDVSMQTINDMAGGLL